MSKIQQYSRVLNHRTSVSGQTFTIPTSNDHTDETWLASDLYIGELGINITDDTAFFRTNNGIVRLNTLSSTSSVTSPWIDISGNVALVSPLATSVTPNVGSYVNLGDTSNPWNSLYLGSDTASPTDIYSGSNGLAIAQASGGILTSGANITSNAPINIYSSSNTSNKVRPLFLNSKYSTIYTGSEIVVASSNGVIVGSFSSNVYVAGVDVNIAESSLNSIHLGNGYSKINSESNRVVVGNLAVRGIADDGTSQYSDSDWVTGQSKIRTSDALTVDLSTISWLEGTVIQVKAFIVGTVINDPSQVYTCEIMGCFSNEMNPISGQPPIIHNIGTPIVSEINTVTPAYTNDVPMVDMAADSSGVYIKLNGQSTQTMQWLCSYSHHRIVNVTP